MPATVNLPSANSISASAASSIWAAIFLPLLTILSIALTSAVPPTASEREHRSHAERNLAGVAVDNLDLVEGEAQPVRHELGEGRLVALAMAVRAGEDGDAAGRVHAHLGALVEAGPRAEPAGHHRGRHGTSLDTRQCRAAQLATRRRFLAAVLEAGVVGGLEHHVERLE